jgi:hypothetical protein
MDSYIEVTGTARAQETAREFYARIEVEVRAAPKAGAGSTATELRNTVVRALRAAGMRDDELVEGGEAIASHWWRKKGEREASRTIVLKCQDYVRMVRAIASLEPLSTDKRTNIDVRMPSPKLGAWTSPKHRPEPPRSVKRATRPTRWLQKPAFASRACCASRSSTATSTAASARITAHCIRRSRRARSSTKSSARPRATSTIHSACGSHSSPCERRARSRSRFAAPRRAARHRRRALRFADHRPRAVAQGGSSTSARRGHPLDQKCVRALASYRNCLAPEDTTLLDRPLDTIANRWRPIVRGTRWEPWWHAFERRYVDLSESEGIASRSA